MFLVYLSVFCLVSRLLLVGLSKSSKFIFNNTTENNIIHRPKQYQCEK